MPIAQRVCCVQALHTLPLDTVVRLAILRVSSMLIALHAPRVRQAQAQTLIEQVATRALVPLTLCLEYAKSAPLLMWLRLTE